MSKSDLTKTIPGAEPEFSEEVITGVVNFFGPEIKALEKYALDHYDAGGHWIAETYDPEDYALALLRAGTHDTIDQMLEVTRNYLRREWEHLNMLEREYAYGDE